jgi:hypothetical protein
MYPRIKNLSPAAHARALCWASGRTQTSRVGFAFFGLGFFGVLCLILNARLIRLALRRDTPVVAASRSSHNKNRCPLGGETVRHDALRSLCVRVRRDSVRGARLGAVHPFLKTVL